MKIVGLKKFTGLLLIVLAVLLLVFWEAKGREVILMDEVLAAKQEIYPSEILDVSMFRVVSVPANSKVEGAFSPDDQELLSGMMSTVKIPKGAQFAPDYVRERTAKEIDEYSFFVLKKEWISMRSSALRRGDIIEIISADGKEYFGKHKVAFVKNEEDEEVTELSGDIGIDKDEGSERTSATAEIDHVEIVSSLDEYMKIKSYAEGNSSPSLILVQREK